MAEGKRNFTFSARRVAGYLIRFLIWLAVILLAIGIVDYLLGWRTLFLYAESLFIAGGLCMAIGALSVMGNWSQTRSFSYQYASSVSSADIATRTRQAMKDAEASYSFSVLAVMAGFSLVGLSILIHQFV